MSPEDAADELFDAYCLCADEDLDDELGMELGVKNSTAIAAAIVELRRRANRDI
jgi:hypothetical protein